MWPLKKKRPRFGGFTLDAYTSVTVFKTNFYNEKYSNIEISITKTVIFLSKIILSFCTFSFHSPLTRNAANLPGLSEVRGGGRSMTVLRFCILT
jgi:hypothetical protein